MKKIEVKVLIMKTAKSEFLYKGLLDASLRRTAEQTGVTKSIWNKNESFLEIVDPVLSPMIHEKRRMTFFILKVRKHYLY